MDAKTIHDAEQISARLRDRLDKALAEFHPRALAWLMRELLQMGTPEQAVEIIAEMGVNTKFLILWLAQDRLQQYMASAIGGE